MTKFLVAALLAAVTPVAAQQAPGGDAPRGGMGMMPTADANGDGVVSREEYLAAADARFARMDANGDGVLQAAERPMRGPAMRRNMRATMPNPMAGGAMGQQALAPTPPAMPPMRDVTRAQFRAAALHRFERLDANNDGRIDAAEMQGAAMMGRFRRAGGPDAAVPPPLPPLPPVR